MKNTTATLMTSCKSSLGFWKKLLGDQKKNERIKCFKITTKRFPKQHIPRNFSVATHKPVAAVSATAAPWAGVRSRKPSLLLGSILSLQTSKVPSAVIPAGYSHAWPAAPPLHFSSPAGKHSPGPGTGPPATATPQLPPRHGRWQRAWP